MHLWWYQRRHYQLILEVSLNNFSVVPITEEVDSKSIEWLLWFLWYMQEHIFQSQYRCPRFQRKCFLLFRDLYSLGDSGLLDLQLNYQRRLLLQTFSSFLQKWTDTCFFQLTNNNLLALFLWWNKPCRCLECQSYHLYQELLGVFVLLMKCNQHL